MKYFGELSKGVYQFIVLIFFDQVLKVWCVSCLGKAGAPSLPETHEENVSKIIVSQAINPSKIQITISFITLFYQCFSYIIQKQSDPARAHQLKLEVIAKALRWLEMDMDLDEVSSTFPSHSLLLITRIIL